MYESPGFFGMRHITDDDERAAKATAFSFKRFAMDFYKLQDLYEPLLWEVKTCKRRKQIILLWFSHAQLLQTLQNFENVRMIYLGLVESRVGSSKPELGSKLLDKFIVETNLFKNFEGMAEEFSSALESLINIIKAGFEDTSGDPKGFNTVAADLRGLVSDLGRRAGEMPRLSAHHLKYLEMRRNMQGSEDLYSLSVIAGVFLPLSLACGVLSMQTRLKDLHYLLYDFCGIVVILVFFIQLLRSSGSVTKYLSQLNLPSNEIGSGRMLGVLFFMAALFVAGEAVILVSFVVGMTSNVRLGGLILGYGMAITLGVAVITYVVLIFSI